MEMIFKSPADVYAVLAIIVVVLIWFVKKSGSPYPRVAPPPRTPRDDIIEARDQVRRQIEIVKSPARMHSLHAVPQHKLEDLELLLQELEDQLKDTR